MGGTAPSRGTSVRIYLPVTTAAPETPLSQLQPNSITIGDLGTGTTAITLLRRAGLL